MLDSYQRPNKVLALDQLQTQLLKREWPSIYHRLEISDSQQHPPTPGLLEEIKAHCSIPWMCNDGSARYEHMLLATPSEINDIYGDNDAVVWYHQIVHTCVQRQPLTNILLWMTPMEQVLKDALDSTIVDGHSLWNESRHWSIFPLAKLQQWESKDAERPQTRP